MKILISFFCSNFDSLKNHWNKNSKLKKRGVFGTNRACKEDLGGRIIILDWKTKKIISKKQIKTPSGIAVDKNNIYLVSEGNKILILDRKLNIKRIITNPLFNCMHNINLVKNGLLCASSGIDSILEIDKNFNLSYKWVATENGYELDQFGKKRVIDLKKDHSNIEYPTLNQTTHINSAIYRDNSEKKIFATLFHQGKLIEIDKESLKSKEILSGLKQPHSVYKIGNNFMLSDTNGKRIVFFNKFGKIIRIINGDFNWIQDTISLKNGNLLVADSNNHRILEISNEGKILDEFKYSKNLKIYQIREV